MTLQARLTQIRDRANTGLTVSQTKHQIVIPILRELGWDDSDPSQVDFDYAVQAERLSALVDIVLRQNDRNIVHIMLCPSESELSGAAERAYTAAEHAQASFALAVSPSRWQCALVRNGRTPQQMCFADFNLHTDSLDELTALLSNYLERAQWLNKRAVPAAESELADRAAKLLAGQVPRALSALVHNADELLVDLVAEQIGDASGIAIPKADIADLLRQSEVTLRIPGDAAVAASAASTSQTTVRRFDREPHEDPVKLDPIVSDGRQVSHTKSPPARVPDRFTLWGETHPVQYWNDMHLAVATMVYERYPEQFVRALELRGERGRRYYGDSLEKMGATSRAEQIPGSGYFVDMNWSAQNAWTRIRGLREHFGHDFSEITFDFG